MSTTDLGAAAVSRSAPFTARAARFLDRYLLWVYTAFAILYLLLPVVEDHRPRIR